MTTVDGRVFISYSREDRAYVEGLAAYFARNGVPVWYDNRIPAGAAWLATIEEEIDACFALVVVMTPAARTSDYVAMELTHARSVGKPVYPVLLAGQRLIQVNFLDAEDVTGGRMPQRTLADLRRRLGKDAEPDGPAPDRSTWRNVPPAGMRIPPDPAAALMVGTGRGAPSLWSAAFAPDGRRIAAVASDGGVHLWDTSTWRPERTMSTAAPGSPVTRPIDGVLPFPQRTTDVLTSMADRFSDLGARLGEREVPARPRRPEHGRRGYTAGYGGHFVAHQSSGVAFSADGRTLAAFTDGRDVSLWDLRSGRERGVLGGHTDTVTKVGFAPVDRIIVTGSRDGTVRLWDADSLHPYAVLDGHSGAVTSLAFAPGGAALAVAAGGRVTRWHPRTGDYLGPVPLGAGRTDEPGWAFTSVAFSPDGRLIAGAATDGVVRVSDVRTGAAVADQRVNTLAYGQPLTPRTAVWDVVFLADGRHLACVGGERGISFWPADRTRHQFDQPPAVSLYRGVTPLMCLTVSPDGRYLAAAGDTNTVEVWELRTNAV